MDEAKVVLKRGRAKPLHWRHPWVFSEAVGRVDGAAEKGGVVAVYDTDGRFIGRGDYNPDSQICVRVFSWTPDEVIDEAFWRRRIEAAVRLRRDVLRLDEQRDAYRLVYSEGDDLPGLVADRYGDWAVMQLCTAAMAARRELLASLLAECSGCANVFELPVPDAARLEKMPVQFGARIGREPPERLVMRQGEAQFAVDLAGGQKTGFFLDQADNRPAAAEYARGRAVLDGYTYSGAFGAWAGLKGAASVLAIDSSAAACALARENLNRNGVANAEVREADMNAELRSLKREGRRFGMIILDPPRFARSRANVTRALRAYHDINLLAMQLLEPEGILVSCSCSGHVTPDIFLRMLNGAAVEARRRVQVLEQRGQAADHPVAAHCPETAYLKCLIGRAD